MTKVDSEHAITSATKAMAPPPIGGGAIRKKKKAKQMENTTTTTTTSLATTTLICPTVEEDRRVEHSHCAVSTVLNWGTFIKWAFTIGDNDNDKIVSHELERCTLMDMLDDRLRRPSLRSFTGQIQSIFLEQSTGDWSLLGRVDEVPLHHYSTGDWSLVGTEKEVPLKLYRKFHRLLRDVGICLIDNIGLLQTWTQVRCTRGWLVESLDDLLMGQRYGDAGVGFVFLVVSAFDVMFGRVKDRASSMSTLVDAVCAFVVVQMQECNDAERVNLLIYRDAMYKSLPSWRYQFLAARLKQTALAVRMQRDVIPDRCVD
jgi:hypothetical protein